MNFYSVNMRYKNIVVLVDGELMDEIEKNERFKTIDNNRKDAPHCSTNC